MPDVSSTAPVREHSEDDTHPAEPTGQGPFAMAQQEPRGGRGRQSISVPGQRPLESGADARPASQSGSHGHSGYLRA
jgi:hypothetical protein